MSNRYLVTYLAPRVIEINAGSALQAKRNAQYLAEQQVPAALQGKMEVTIVSIEQKHAPKLEPQTS